MEVYVFVYILEMLSLSIVFICQQTQNQPTIPCPTPLMSSGRLVCMPAGTLDIPQDLEKKVWTASRSLSIPRALDVLHRASALTSALMLIKENLLTRSILSVYRHSRVRVTPFVRMRNWRKQHV